MVSNPHFYIRFNMCPTENSDTDLDDDDDFTLTLPSSLTFFSRSGPTKLTRSG